MLMNIGEEYKCHSKYAKNHEYNCMLEDTNKIRIYKDDWNILITKSMFNKLFEINYS